MTRPTRGYGAIPPAVHATPPNRYLSVIGMQ